MQEKSVVDPGLWQLSSEERQVGQRECQFRLRRLANQLVAVAEPLFARGAKYKVYKIERADPSNLLVEDLPKHVDLKTRLWRKDPPDEFKNPSETLTHAHLNQRQLEKRLTAFPTEHYEERLIPQPNKWDLAKYTLDNAQGNLLLETFFQTLSQITVNLVCNPERRQVDLLTLAFIRYPDKESNPILVPGRGRKCKNFEALLHKMNIDVQSDSLDERVRAMKSQLKKIGEPWMLHLRNELGVGSDFPSDIFPNPRLNSYPNCLPKASGNSLWNWDKIRPLLNHQPIDDISSEDLYRIFGEQFGRDPCELDLPLRQECPFQLPLTAEQAETFADRIEEAFGASIHRTGVKWTEHPDEVHIQIPLRCDRIDALGMLERMRPFGQPLGTCDLASTDRIVETPQYCIVYDRVVSSCDNLAIESTDFGEYLGVRIPAVQ